MRDYIYSYRSKQILAIVEYEADGTRLHYYQGKIIENHLPVELLTLIDEYHKLVDEMVLSLLDEVEAKIYHYDLRLRNSGDSLFCLKIIDGDMLYFFKKYPSGQGYLDRYPAVK